jgi:beta-glucosidase
MKGRTYRYFSGDVQYPFGFGLSFTSFDYQWTQAPRNQYRLTDTLSVVVTVKNTGAYDGDEVVQAYLRYPDLERMPVMELKQFRRIHLTKGADQKVILRIPVAELRKWDLKKKSWQLYKGEYTIVVGSHSRDERLKASFKL